MVESLARLSKEGADDCRFGGAIILREFGQLFDVVNHDGTRSNRSITSFRSSSSNRIGGSNCFKVQNPIRLERSEAVERLERLERVHVCHFGGTGTTVPQFLHVRSFSSLENFW